MDGAFAVEVHVKSSEFRSTQGQIVLSRYSALGISTNSYIVKAK